ncbi:glycoside hydrolase family 45 protein, partial [Piromyces sp. E2]
SSSTNKNGSLPDIEGGEMGKTTRYWDCCLASCAWKENTGGPVVNACKIDGETIITNFNYKIGNVCSGGSGFMCNNNQPWGINDHVAYGFAAASFANSSQSNWCCGCYRLQFTSGSVKGKQMIVQVTNTGSDLSSNHFDIQIPGGGVGVFNGCQKQWNTSENGWGERFGGISSRSECSSLPKELQDGCFWRFDWFKNADNPEVVFERVQCPVELTSKSGC